ncbi:unnamed protein product [Protopolystoma xenopodis]|uniref:Hexosyltransferase n=1 Tax=Protopolystoma xenopodis TaxID=117903 RepID=A0A3S5B1C6_9PLAT|nr:unnamed protein product [Protopolystoma xenopodis]
MLGLTWSMTFCSQTHFLVFLDDDYYLNVPALAALLVELLPSQPQNNSAPPPQQLVKRLQQQQEAVASDTFDRSLTESSQGGANSSQSGEHSFNRTAGQQRSQVGWPKQAYFAGKKERAVAKAWVASQANLDYESVFIGRCWRRLILFIIVGQSERWL